jgi:predicted SAM-dependent methyltransferase
MIILLSFRPIERNSITADMNISDILVTALSYYKQPKKRDLIKEAYKLKGQRGIEIGGPTAFFSVKGGFPVYLFADKIDNVNYESESFFGNYQKGQTFRYYKNKVGMQYIAEATDLKEIANASYDFLLSSHSLEHTANPLKALKEWNRVIRPGGRLVLLLPDKRFTFDHRRDYTTFEHLQEDYDHNTSEHDTTHVEEILSTYDEEKVGTPKEEYRQLVGNNFTNRCAHHHVFSQEVVRKALRFAGFTVDTQYEIAPHHLVTLAHK